MDLSTFTVDSADEGLRAPLALAIWSACVGAVLIYLMPAGGALESLLILATVGLLVLLRFAPHLRILPRDVHRQ